MGGGDGEAGIGRRTESQDLADDADYLASQQQVNKFRWARAKGSRNKQQSKESGNTSANSPGPDGSEVVYVKDNVSIHPTQYAFERINGRLRLIKQGSSLFMTWIPYKQNATMRDGVARILNSKTTEKDRNLYTIRAVPLAEVRSIRRHTPPLGWQYVIVVLVSGLAFPPLYFYNGGVREFLATLKEHVFLVRSSEDANVFLVNDIQDPLQRSLSSLELPGALPIINSISSFNVEGSRSAVENTDATNKNHRHRNSGSPKVFGDNHERLRDPARDISIHVLEKFSLVTKLARETTAHLFGENRLSGNIDDSEEIYTTKLDNQHENEEPAISSSAENGTSSSSDSLEHDQPTLVWGKHRQPPLGSDEWATFLDCEGRLVDPKALKKRIFYGGIEHNIRQEVWKFLLGYYQFDSTQSERHYLALSKKEEYQTLKSQWQSVSQSQAKRFSKFRERKSRIEKDVVRTDRTLPYYEGDDNPNLDRLRDILLTYSFYNFDLGYCQGMSDLLSPILFVVEDESESFWCFVALMERLGPNFDRDQNGMHSQLLALSKLVELLDSPLHNYFKQVDCLNYFFCFRWILIQFKREFEYEKVMRLWEVLWTHYLSEHFHLYVCTALLKRHRKKIMEEQMDFDTLLKFINELSCHIDLETTLRDAEALCICAGDAGSACIPPGTPPSLPDVSEAY
uniref:TBC1 domain family member 15 n=1 Tax=Wollemia nobilis TaxID=56998 RepID=A0A0C9RV14_9CONI